MMSHVTLSGIVYIVLGRQADILEYRIVLFFHSCFDHNTHHNNKQQQPKFRSLRNIFLPHGVVCIITIQDPKNTEKGHQK